MKPLATTFSRRLVSKYLYVEEAVDVLSAQAPGLDEALERALAEGVPYAMADDSPGDLGRRRR